MSGFHLQYMLLRPLAHWFAMRNFLNFQNILDTIWAELQQKLGLQKVVLFCHFCMIAYRKVMTNVPN
jgi:hypothetical protein